MYMVSDLLLGGDLRFHLNQQGKFAEDRAKLYICEISLAVEYLHKNHIIHRDIKPENILLDDQGHAHLTDLNLATKLEDDQLATSFSGTRPYMAPEIYGCAVGDVTGYNDRVDWWSLGVAFYEMLRGRTPFELSSKYTPEQILIVLTESCIAFPASWTSDLISFLRKMMSLNPAKRMASIDDVKNHPYTERINFEAVLHLKTAPVFVPCKEGLNCDPMHEIEERILVSTPIHKRRHYANAHANCASTPIDTNSADHTPQSLALHEISQVFVFFSKLLIFDRKRGDFH
ncbi:hypothetical protein WR25_26505 isoform D [Diploscapter pachys]|nr:hypothetical protein WR25_26505 isoform C [Diploscapter pachys]PAV86019.1 hypothetical protein WR25_26505 isoform D [Diploscapter pachys]